MAKQVSKGKNGRYAVVQQVDVPHLRKGKHHDLVGGILDELAEITRGQALKLERRELGTSIEKLRSALGRSSRLRGIEVATSADETHLYVWRKAAAES